MTPKMFAFFCGAKWGKFNKVNICRLYIYIFPNKSLLSSPSTKVWGHWAIIVSLKFTKQVYVRYWLHQPEFRALAKMFLRYSSCCFVKSRGHQKFNKDKERGNMFPNLLRNMQHVGQPSPSGMICWTLWSYWLSMVIFVDARMFRWRFITLRYNWGLVVPLKTPSHTLPPSQETNLFLFRILCHMFLIPCRSYTVDGKNPAPPGMYETL